MTFYLFRSKPPDAITLYLQLLPEPSSEVSQHRLGRFVTFLLPVSFNHHFLFLPFGQLLRSFTSGLSLDSESRIPSSTIRSYTLSIFHFDSDHLQILFPPPLQ